MPSVRFDPIFSPVWVGSPGAACLAVDQDRGGAMRLFEAAISATKIAPKGFAEFKFVRFGAQTMNGPLRELVPKVLERKPKPRSRLAGTTGPHRLLVKQFGRYPRLFSRREVSGAAKRADRSCRLICLNVGMGRVMRVSSRRRSDPRQQHSRRKGRAFTEADPDTPTVRSRTCAAAAARWRCWSPASDSAAGAPCSAPAADERGDRR